MFRIFDELGLVGKFGVATGQCYCGGVGSPARMEHTVLGESVNLSPRLMANAKGGSLLCDEETQRLLSDAVVCKPLEPMKVKGKATPIPIFQLSQKEAVASCL